MAIFIVFAIGLIVFAVERHQVRQRKTVMRGQKVDRTGGRAAGTNAAGIDRLRSRPGRGRERLSGAGRQ